ncbi:unnamed protein product [marine sediment metagenome]|uniref:Uncharacterized protein n=1 Tax=marine sediment metagenome TaxID=412755 RepID=X1KPG1_9ZZZZ
MGDMVFLVFFSKGNLRTFCGVFSTEERAQKYIDGVPEDERVWWYSRAAELDSDFV